MGVDFLVCGICGDTFPDCGPAYNCACEDDICQDCHGKQKQKYGLSEDEDTIDMFGDSVLKECDSCTSSIIRDSDIVDFLVKKHGTTREETVGEINESRKG